jgi:hypothetical protein
LFETDQHYSSIGNNADQDSFAPIPRPSSSF